MANTKISDLTALTGANVDTANDLLAIVDTSTTTTKKILIDQFRIALGGGGTLGTPQATTSGSSVTFTGIPTWATKITVNFSGVSTNGTASILVQLGDSGGIETSGYLSTGISVNTAGSAGGATSTGGFIISSGAAANVIDGSLILTMENASTWTWCANGVFSASAAAIAFFTSGVKATSAATDRVRIITTDTFDAGEINIHYA